MGRLTWAYYGIKARVTNPARPNAHLYYGQELGFTGEEFVETQKEDPHYVQLCGA